MDTKTNPRLPLPKIDQLVDDAKTELKRVGIENGTRGAKQTARGMTNNGSNEADA